VTLQARIIPYLDVKDGRVARSGVAARTRIGRKAVVL
jgi:imidazole glycerol phosphate synthase subunit HisF